MGLFTRKVRSGSVVSNAAELEHKRWKEDLERRVVTGRTLSWEVHKASARGHILALQGLVAEESAESYTGKDAEWKEHLIGREGFLAGLVAEAATFDTREQAMCAKGEIR